MLKINNIKMPTPSSYDLNIEDLDSEESRRLESGYLTRSVIRKNVHKLNLSWKNIYDNDVKLIKDNISKDYFTVLFKTEVGAISANMYAGSRRFKLIRSINGRNIWEMSVNLVEL